MSSVIAAYEYEPSEHYHALRAITNQTPLRWVTLIMGGVLPVLLVIVVIWTIRTQGTDPLTAAMSGLPYLLLFIFWASLIPVSQWRRAKRLPKLDMSVQGPQERRVDADGYHARGNGVALDIPWHAFKKAVETEQFFIFFYTWQCGYYLPKRTLDAPDVSTVRQLARAALGDRARLWA